MPPRFKKPCYRCPSAEDDRRRGFAVDGTASPASPAAAVPTLNGGTTLAVTSESEGLRLWRHVLFGAGTCIGMIEGYQCLGMPGNPKDDLVVLRDRLHNIITKIEATNEDPVPDERQPPVEPLDAPDGNVEHEHDA